MLAALAERERRRRAARDLPLLDWMHKHRSQLAPYRSFDIKNHKYLVDIYNCKAQKMVLYKAAQMGISEYMISCALYGCSTLMATTLYIFPTDGSASDFATERLGPAIDASDYINSLVTTGTERGADRVKLKRIGDRFLYFRGAKVNKEGKAPQLKSVAADQIIIDEVDECDQRAIPLAQKRLGHSQIALERYGSTPSYEGVGIHALYQQSDKRRWFIPCSACGHQQNVTIENVVTNEDALGRPTEWYGQEDGKAYAACSKCKRKLDLSVDGEWIAEHPHIDTAGFHVTKFAAPWVKIDAIIESLGKIDETTRREATNQDLGLPYEAQGLSVTKSLLRSLRRNYGHGAMRGRPCYMGVDVGSVLHVVVREAQHPETGERKQLYAGTVGTFDDLIQLIAVYKPATIVCDALPETRKVRETQDELRRGTFWACYYDNIETGSKRDESTAWKRREGTVTADRTRTLDETVARFVGKDNTLPGYIDDIADYADQVTAPVRIVEAKVNGTRVAKYVCSVADHYFHAENYCTIASMRRPLSQMG